MDYSGVQARTAILHHQWTWHDALNMAVACKSLLSASSANDVIKAPRHHHPNQAQFAQARHSATFTYQLAAFAFVAFCFYPCHSLKNRLYSASSTPPTSSSNSVQLHSASIVAIPGSLPLFLALTALQQFQPWLPRATRRRISRLQITSSSSLPVRSPPHQLME